ncbi:MAG: guanylate kinase [Clostridiales bacterium GWE2_32_10]|nr:MAG: guanylate kinase [Clostridiales bacterium GWE2_32_10]HBY20052.1 guanylate kinase [Clostridiales bacterium]
MENLKGVPVVISAFGGVGKGAIINELVKDEEYVFSISATSRKMRKEDIEGKTYFFKTREEFENMIRRNELLEWVEFCGNYYGTPKGYIEQQMNDNKNVLLDIEEVGAIKIKETYKDVALIYVMPPSLEELIFRLKKRGETEKYINTRIAKAKQQVGLVDYYDYIIINDKLNVAIQEIKNIVKTSKQKVVKNKELIGRIKEELENVKTII